MHGGKEKWADFFSASKRAIIRALVIMVKEKWKFYSISEFIRKLALTHALQMGANGRRSAQTEWRWRLKANHEIAAIRDITHALILPWRRCLRSTDITFTDLSGGKKYNFEHK